MASAGRLARLAAVVAFAAAATITATGGAQAAADEYVAMGDSYASGVGTRDYDEGSGDCYRSPAAYGPAVADTIGAELTFVACSGAVVADVRNNQLDALGDATTHVTVQVGGNDAGFAPVITSCARPWPYTCWDDIDEANRIITDELPGRLDTLYGEIRAAAPNAAVAVVGYPKLFNEQECNSIARISPGEQAELNNTGDLLASTISTQAAAHGFDFVDVREAFTGHEVCSDDEWVNGVSYPVLESYHPNKAGQADGYTPLVGGVLGAAAPVE